MLDEQERRELLDMASSQAIAEEFRSLKKGSRIQDPSSMDLDVLLDFLSACSRFAPSRVPVRLPRPYARVLL